MISLKAITTIVLLAASFAAAQATTPARADGGAAAQSAADSKAVVDAFVEHVKNASGIDAKARSAVLQIWQARKSDDDPQALMTSSMAVLSKPYKQALDAVDAGEYAKAVDALEPLTKSDDAYLAAYAAALEARALVEDDHTERAQKVLEGMVSAGEGVSRHFAKAQNGDRPQSSSFAMSKTFLGPETLFMLGYCQLSNLDYERAAATLGQFEKLYPQAPDQYRLPVRQMLQELAGRQPKGLGDVSDLMLYAQRQLKHARVDEAVQTRQKQAVQLLTQLIEDTEKNEQQQQQQQQQQASKGGKNSGSKSGSGGSPSGNRQAQRGADRSMLPGGAGRMGDLHASSRAHPGEHWGQMRPEQRERVLQAVRQNFPSRYRQLVEQYYKQLAKEE